MLVAMWFLFVATIAIAQDVSTIVARYRQSIGNAAKLERLQSWSIDGLLTGSDGSWQRSYRVWCMGERIRTELTLQPGITAITWTDGTRGWSIQPWASSQEPQPMNEASLFRLRSYTNVLVNDLLKNSSLLRFEGTDEIEGSECYKLQCRHSDGSIWTYYIDPDAYLPVKLTAEATIRGERLEWETVFSNYRQIDDVLLPTVLTISGTTTIVKRYHLDVPLDEKFFAPPTK